jgi:hypothetical protein
LVATASAAPSRSPERQRDSARSEREPARSTTTSSAPSSDGVSSGRLADDTVVPSEVELLKEARSALGVDPARAFALTERCRARYPSGSFAQEREFIAVSALYRMGRSEEARSRLSLFKMHYPSSAYLPALNRLLGEP